MKSLIRYSPDGRTVIKTCRTPEECDNELRVYRLELDNTPKLLRVIDNKTIEIERIHGVSLSDTTDFDFSQPGRIFSRLHRVLDENGKSLCHLDTNPRNYLIEEKTNAFYLIDFSESGFSFPENDLINFLLFWAAILPDKLFESSMKDFLSGYEAAEYLDKDRQKTEFADWINIFDERRRRFCRSPGTVYNRQKNNREYLLHNFYRLLQ